MAEAVVLEFHPYGEGLIVAAAAFNLIALEADCQLVDVELVVGVQEEGVKVDAGQLLRTTPGILEYLNEDIANEGLFQQFGVLSEVELGQQHFSSPRLLDAQEVFIVKSFLPDSHESVGNHPPGQFGHVHQSLKEGKIASLAGLVHSIDFTAEPAAVVEGKSLGRFLIEGKIEHESDDCGASAALAVVAVHCHYSQLVV
jgi:hypothetical protein